MGVRFPPPAPFFSTQKLLFFFCILCAFTSSGCATAKHSKKTYTGPPLESILKITLHEKARKYDMLVVKNHSPAPQNLIVTSQISHEGMWFDDFYDAALWTGCYLASQSYRYRVTKDPGGLSNIRRSLSGIKTLLKITGEKGTLARYYFSTGSQKRDDLIPGKGDFSEFEYINDISRDQYIGIMFGLGVALDLVPEAEQNLIRGLIREIVVAFEERKWRIKDLSGAIWKPSGTLHPKSLFGLNSTSHLLSFSLLHQKTGDPENKYNENAKEFGQYLDKIFLKPNIYFDYFAFNLHYLSFFNLMRLESDPVRKDQYKEAFLKKIWSLTKGHENALFNYIYSANIKKEKKVLIETRKLLQEFPLPPRRNYAVRNSQKDQIKTTWSLMNLLLFKNEIRFAKKPIPVWQRPPTDFLWQRTPFALDGGGNGSTEYPGIDFLLPYWMGRYYGFIGSEE